MPQIIETWLLYDLNCRRKDRPIRGHWSFSSGDLPGNVRQNDLRAEHSQPEGHQMIGEAALGPALGGWKGHLFGDFEHNPMPQENMTCLKGFLNGFFTCLNQNLGCERPLFRCELYIKTDCFGHWLYHSWLYNFETQQTAFSISPVEDPWILHFRKAVDYRHL